MGEFIKLNKTKMLTRTVINKTRLLQKVGSFNMIRNSARVFSSDIGIGDAGDVLKVNYTEEFDQGLTAEQKAEMKRFDIFRSNPNDPEDRPKYMSYYIDTNKCGPMFLCKLIDGLLTQEMSTLTKDSRN